ncbi:uncharacterized protein LOC122715329 [Apis laboriosa]|uniref:uncharacterized protein LOC122715329 n=1 Tax=Apis laboriosa TaxID=183418 RepID=UPI001CC5AB1F|nr:uncharacterized protein LOC122715329 [Apis laboriosa]
MGVKEGTTRRIAGDGLSVDLQSNEQILEIKGDGCDITMSKNRGSVKVIGDGCRLRIVQNMGDVEYTGDGGQVLLGPKSSRDKKVKYVGDGGRIRFDVELTMRNRKSRKEEGAGKETVDEEKKKSREETENDLNGRKETKQSGKEEKKREKLARIVTTFEYDEKIVKKWFVNPGKVTRNLGGSFVRIVPKEKTKI